MSQQKLAALRRRIRSKVAAVRGKGHGMVTIKVEESNSRCPVAMETGEIGGGSGGGDALGDVIGHEQGLASGGGGGGGGANGKELLVLSLAVILSLTTRQAPWDELASASASAIAAAASSGVCGGVQLPPDLMSLGQLSPAVAKSDRIADWLAANPLAVGARRSAYPTTVVAAPLSLAAAAATDGSLWSDQDTVALAFYQQQDAKDLMLNGFSGGLSVLPKPPGSGSNGSRSPPASWWDTAAHSSNGSRSEEHLSEAEMQINAELDQLFNSSAFDRLIGDDFDPDSFLGLLDEPAAAAVTGGELIDELTAAGGADGDGDSQFEESAALRALLHNHTYAASAAASAYESSSSSSSQLPWQPYPGREAVGEAKRLAPSLTSADEDTAAASATVVSAQDMRSALHRNKDPARLAGAGVKLAYEDVVTCSHQRFLAALQGHSRRQQAVLQEVRKRGKNRLAASKCRQKKTDRVGRVREELTELGQRTGRLGAQMETAQAEERRLRDKYMQLYLTAFGRLRDAEGRPLDPRLHRLQHGLDGSVILVARDAAA